MEILVADGGSTHCKWGLIGANRTSYILTDGVNPYFLTKEAMFSILEKQLLPKLLPDIIGAVYFYGAGMGALVNRESIRSALQTLFPNSSIVVGTDLLAAARSLCQQGRGIVCILGTGSNSCLFDGSLIISQGHSLGYLLGDEGSGSYLGRIVIRHYLYGKFDQHLSEAFERRFEARKEEILLNVYQRPLANRYIASFAPFLSENRGHPQIEQLVWDGLNDFIEALLPCYVGHLDLAVHFCGSVAFSFDDVIAKLCAHHGMVLGKVKSPLEGLVGYHASKGLINDTN